MLIGPVWVGLGWVGLGGGSKHALHQLFFCVYELGFLVFHVSARLSLLFVYQPERHGWLRWVGWEREGRVGLFYLGSKC